VSVVVIVVLNSVGKAVQRPTMETKACVLAPEQNRKPGKNKIEEVINYRNA
jgi:hypothetical protein